MGFDDIEFRKRSRPARGRRKSRSARRLPDYWDDQDWFANTCIQAATAAETILRELGLKHIDIYVEDILPATNRRYPDSLSNPIFAPTKSVLADWSLQDVNWLTPTRKGKLPRQLAEYDFVYQGWVTAKQIYKFLAEAISGPFGPFAIGSKSDPLVSGPSIVVTIVDDAKHGKIELVVSKSVFDRITLADDASDATSDRSRDALARAFSSAFQKDAIRGYLSRSGLIEILSGRELKSFLDNITVQMHDEFINPFIDLIGPGRTFHFLPTGSIAERLAKFDEYAENNPERTPSQLVQEVFPELVTKRVTETAPSLPKRAPELWAKRKNKDEAPPQFATRVYRVWMDAEVLTRPDLKRLDPQLFASLDNWLKHNRRKAKPDPLPVGFKLLTIEQSNDTWVNKVAHGQVPFPTDKDELARFAAVLYERIRAPRARE